MPISTKRNNTASVSGQEMEELRCIILIYSPRNLFQDETISKYNRLAKPMYTFSAVMLHFGADVLTSSIISQKHKAVNQGCSPTKGL